MTRAEAIHALDTRWYPGVPDNWDDELFRTIILRHLRPDSIVLDVGAGAGIVKQMNFRGVARRVCGIDLDERVLQNPYLDEAAVGTADALPHSSASFDLVFADNVLEHLPTPQRTFAEISRVLKPNGIFLGKTPNKWHYMPLIARCTPLRFHKFYNRLRGRASIDTFPTTYLANSRRALKKLAQNAGLEVIEIRFYESRPEYLRFNAATYTLGHYWERLVNCCAALEDLRILIVVHLRKPSS